jgi:PKD repeat protein
MSSHFVVKSNLSNLHERSSLHFRVLLFIPIAFVLFGLGCRSSNGSTTVTTSSPTGTTGGQPLSPLTLTAAPISGITPLSVSFGATCTACMTYAWSFGDGSSGSGATPTHMYTSAGAYSVVVTATARYGGTATQNTVITANNPTVPVRS